MTELAPRALRPNPDHVFQHELALCAARGWQIRHQDPVSRTAVLWSPGGDPHHLVHLVLSIFTLLIWTPVWVLFAICTPGPKQMILSVGGDGTPSYTKPQPPGKTQ